jgi:hypothetical protein
VGGLSQTVFESKSHDYGKVPQIAPAAKRGYYEASINFERG